MLVQIFSINENQRINRGKISENALLSSLYGNFIFYLCTKGKKVRYFYLYLFFQRFLNALNQKAVCLCSLNIFQNEKINEIKIKKL